MSDTEWAIAGIAVTLVMGIAGFFFAKTIKNKTKTTTISVTNSPVGGDVVGGNKIVSENKKV